MREILNGSLSNKLEIDALELFKNQHKVVNQYLNTKGLKNQVDSYFYNFSEKLSNLWHNGSIYRYLLHHSQDTTLNFEEFLQQFQPPYEINNYTFEDLKIKVIEKSHLFEFLFKFFKHPDYDKNLNAIHVGFATNEDREIWYNTLSNALLLIKDSDELHYQMLLKYLDCICPVYLKTPLQKGNVISFTSDYSVGLIVYSHCPKILAAETLIHETRHNVLFSLMESCSLIKDNSILVKTPLREDARPLSGLFHQAYVLCGLSRFYSKISLKSEYGLMENVIKRAKLQYKDYKFSLDVLNDNKHHLTDVGIEILELMKEDLKKYL